MPPPRRRQRRRQWYTLSVDTLRALWFLFLLGVLAFLSLGLYRAWQGRMVEREAARLIEEARSLIQRLQGEGKLGEVRQEYETAFQSFEQARLDYGRGAYRAARDSGRRSVSVLRSIFDALALPGAAGEAQFISLQGTVEVRRGAATAWEEARNRMPLQQGDFVRTAASGSAEIRFLDGTLYTVRPNTQFVVTPTPAAIGPRGEQEIRMEYGWVDLNTSTRSSRVKTPGAEARVEQDSEAFVAYERATRQGRFGTFRGTMELASARGERRAVGELQQVIERGGRLSPPRPLPGRPEPVEPIDNLEVALGRVERLALAWRPVPGAARYALQVSRNRLFTDNVIDVANRTKTTATLGVRGAGSFQWRVAAVGRDGARGPWSAPRAFRVAAYPGAPRGDGDDTTPPRIDLAEVQTYGTILIIGGKTEPGSEVAINGEPVKVEADGSFTKPVQLTQEGWSFIEVTARDAAGNEAELQRRVFVDNP